MNDARPLARTEDSVVFVFYIVTVWIRFIEQALNNTLTTIKNVIIINK